MEKYLIRSLITALVFIGLTLLFDAIFGEVGDFRKYLITGFLFGFIYEGWWHLYQKGVFSRKKPGK
jgi:hypothetical protein